MKALIILPILMYNLSVPLFAQKPITGQVTDYSDGFPVPYVTIGIRDSHIGTVSDDNGIFRLVLPEKSVTGNTVMVFSSVGYVDTAIRISELENSGKINVALKPDIHEIPEVIISSKPPKEVVYGNRSRARTTYFNFYHVREEFDDGLGRELGKILKVDPEIKLVELGFYISGSRFNQVKFRVNLYDMSGEVPEKIRLAKDIVFDINKQKGWVNVDLAPYEIYLSGNEKIGVTIQWLQSEHDGSKHQYFSIPAGVIAFNGGMYRAKSEAPWDFPKVNLSMYVKALSY